MTLATPVKHSEHQKYWTCPFDKLQQMKSLSIEGISEVKVRNKTYFYAQLPVILLLLREHFPLLSVEFDEIKVTPAGCILRCWLYDNESGLKSNSMYYAVQGTPFQGWAALEEPSSRNITDSMVRATVKLIAFETGIGLDLFIKFPEDETDDQYSDKRRTKKRDKKPLRECESDEADDDDDEPSEPSWAQKVLAKAKVDRENWKKYPLNYLDEGDDDDDDGEEEEEEPKKDKKPRWSR